MTGRNGSAAPFDKKAMAAGHRFGLDEEVPSLGAEGRDIDHRQRIGGFQPQPAAWMHGRQTLLRLEDGQRAVQPAKIVDVRGCSHLAETMV